MTRRLNQEKKAADPRISGRRAAERGEDRTAARESGRWNRGGEGDDSAPKKVGKSCCKKDRDLAR